MQRLSAVLRDISSEVAARNALLLQTSTLQSVTEALPAMVAVVGIDGCYRFVNSAFERWVGLPRSDLLGRRVADVMGPVEFDVRQPWIARVLAGESVSFETSEPTRRVRHLSITYIPLRNEGVIDGNVGVAQDITRHKDETGRLLQLAQRDALTGLLNRTGLEYWLKAGDDEVRAGTLALLYVDLDYFKPVNDTFGHLAGDRVLWRIRASAAIARSARRRRGAHRRRRIRAGALGRARARARRGHRREGRRHRRRRRSRSDALVITHRRQRGHRLPGVARRRRLAGLIDHADGRLYEAKASGRGTFA